MLIPFSSESVLTIKFGALPIYVLAPINTAPQEIAESSFTGTVPSVVAIPLVNPRVPCCCQKYQIGRRIIQEAGQSSSPRTFGYGLVIPRFGPTAFRSIRAAAW